MTDWGQLRICVEKPLPHEQAELDHLCKNCNSEQHAQILRAAYYKKKIWPVKSKNGSPTVITVQFLEAGNQVDWTPPEALEGVDQNGNKILPDPLNKELYRKVSPREMVETVVRKRIAPNVGLKFKFVDEGGMVRVTFDPKKGAYSLVGTDCLHKNAGQETMNLGWLDVGTVTHEFMHAIGAIHEHQNPNGVSIDWDEKKVFNWARTTQGWNRQTTEVNIIDKYSIDQLNTSKFDPDSIMLYFYPKYLTEDNKGTRQNVRLSPTDVMWMNKIYPGSRISPENFYKSTYNTGFTEKDGLYIPDDESRSGDGSKSKTGMIIGIVIGSVVGAILLGVIIWLLITRVNWSGRSVYY